MKNQEANKKAFEKTVQNIKTETIVQEKPSERYGSKLKKSESFYLN